MKKIKFIHPDYLLIIKAELLRENGQVVVKNVNFGLPKKATKLEKLLLKYVEIYCFDVFRNNVHNLIIESKEYKKFSLSAGEK